MTLPQIDISPLSHLQDEEKKQFVGNSIYSVIQQAHGDEYAPKITGMLLDENVVNFSQLLSDSAYFSAKVEEALALLKST
jgi:hypothetical protein